MQSARTREPMASDFSLSDMGRQVTPPSVEFQTPPPAVPIQMSKKFAGLTATAVARPASPPGKKQQDGAGPIGNQEVPWMTACAGTMAARAKAKAQTTAQVR